MKRFLPPACLCLVALFARLGEPALWQDEAETAMLATGVLARGYPAVRLGENVITVEPSLRRHESDSGGAFIWNTWLPYYAAAGGLALFGRTAWAARLPFACFAFLAYLSAVALYRKTDDAKQRTAEIAAWWLACNIPWLLFMRQCRYYSLVCFGAMAAVLSYRALLRGVRGAPACLVGSLLFLLHSSFAYAPIVLLALGADACLRPKETAFQKKFWPAAAAFAALALPTAAHFRIWSRPGNHSYPAVESLRFLRTFLSWLSRFAVPTPLLAAFAWKRTSRSARAAAAGAAAWLAALAVLDGEGWWADLGGAAMLSALGLCALRLPAPERDLGAGRLAALLCASCLAVLSWSGAEPYGRYLVILLPFLCYAAAACVAAMSGSRAPVAAGLTLLCLTSNLVFFLPGRAAALLGSGAPPETVSGMMRQRLRDLTLRSDLWSFWAELRKGRRGYVEEIGDHMLAHGKPTDRFFSDSDNLSLLFYTGRRSMLPDDLDSAAPDWIIPSPWLRLDSKTSAKLRAWLDARPYSNIMLQAPMTLWQDNPDILYHAFNPRLGPRTVYHLLQKSAAKTSAKPAPDSASPSRKLQGA